MGQAMVTSHVETCRWLMYCVSTSKYRSTIVESGHKMAGAIMGS